MSVQLFYLTYNEYGPTVSTRTFYRATGKNRAERLCKLLRKFYESESHCFQVSPADDLDEDDRFLTDQYLADIETYRDVDDWTALDYRVPDILKRLVEFARLVETWDAKLTQAEHSEENQWFYIALKWFEEGDEGRSLVYKVYGKRIADAICDALREEYPTAEPDKCGAFLVGPIEWYEAMPAASLPEGTRCAWDQQWEHLNAGGADSAEGEDKTPRLKDCRQWEERLRAQLSNEQQDDDALKDEKWKPLLKGSQVPGRVADVLEGLGLDASAHRPASWFERFELSDVNLRKHLSKGLIAAEKTGADKNSHNLYWVASVVHRWPQRFEHVKTVKGRESGQFTVVR